MEKYIFLAFTVILFSCTDTTPEPKYFYKMVNQTDHQIAVVVEGNQNPDFPDSLVLLKHDEFDWNYKQRRYVFLPFGVDKPVIKLYYDNIYIYDNLYQNPAFFFSYKHEGYNNRRDMLLTYFFTEEDYQRAVEENQRE